MYELANIYGKGNKPFKKFVPINKILRKLKSRFWVHENNFMNDLRSP